MSIDSSSPTAMLTNVIASDAWATRCLLEQSRSVSEDVFHQRFPIGPGSLHDAFVHIVATMGRWSDRIAGRELRESIQMSGKRFTVDQLIAELNTAEHDLSEVLSKCTADDRLLERMPYTGEDGKTVHFGRVTAFLHVAMHGVHHRAQIQNMRRQLGLPALERDFDPIEWELIQTGQLAT